MKISRRKALRISGASIAGISAARLVPISGRDITCSPSTACGVHAANGSRDTLSRQLARFVIQTRFEDLPKPIADAWKTIVLDSLAVGFVGSKDRLATAVTEVARK